MFAWLARRAEPPDGAVPALETVATGISPAFLDVAAEPSAPGTRRDWIAQVGSGSLEEVLAQKILHGWLQNQHQTLVPLTFNLRTLTPEQRDVLAAGIGALLLAGRPSEAIGDAAAALRSRFESLGADAATLDALSRGLKNPPPLHAVLEQVQALDLAISLYVGALLASDRSYPASVMLCDVIQARFALPASIVRTAIRRYQR